MSEVVLIEAALAQPCSTTGQKARIALVADDSVGHALDRSVERGPGRTLVARRPPSIFYPIAGGALSF